VIVVVADLDQATIEAKVKAMLDGVKKGPAFQRLKNHHLKFIKTALMWSNANWQPTMWKVLPAARSRVRRF
jgi:hypothetical protein